MTAPLAILTSSLALFAKDGLELPSPITFNPSDKNNKTGTVVINGASSSIGSYAIQLAKLVGWRVIGIAGAGGEYAKSLGADVVVDYRGKTQDELVKELQSHGPFTAVYDCVASLDTIKLLTEVLQPQGGKLIYVNLQPEDELKKFSKENVTSSMVFVETTHNKDAEFGREYCAWYTKAFEEGKLQGNRFRVMPNGLEGVSKGLELLENNKVRFSKEL